MTFARARPRRHALLAALLLAWQGLAPAQTAAPTAAPTSTQAPTPTPAPAPYVDREIEGLPPQEVDDAPATDYDASGWPRYLRLEARLASDPFDRRGGSYLGYGGYGQLETPNHGALSFDGQYSPRSGGGTLTLRQRGVPLGDGWIGNHELGLINSLAPGLTRLPSRVYVPSSYLRGLSGEWERPESGWQWQLSSGQPGRLGILPDTRFITTPGRRHTLGAQWRPSSNDGWGVALQHERADGVRPFGLPDSAPLLDADATRLALRRDAGALRWQAQWLSDRTSALAGSRQGGWADVEWDSDSGAWSHGVGAYRLDTGLSWAGQPMASDLEGLYLRTRYLQRRWSADGSLDWLRSISRRDSRGFYGTGNLRWRVGRDSQASVGLAVRDLDGRDWSAYGDWRWTNDLGASGLRLEAEGGDNRRRLMRLVHDQEWPVSTGWALSSSLGIARQGEQAGRGPTGNQWTAALNASVPVGQRAGLRGSLSTEQGPGSAQRSSINLNANWRLNNRWELEGSWVWNRGQFPVVASLDPLTPPVVVDQTLSGRSFYLLLRYQRQAGSRDFPLGGQAGQGGGRLEGVVFFDGNRNGEQEANELGVPNATVFLDNRYAIRTDSQGRFEFPLVASGTHTVTLRADSLPLPWNVVGDGSLPTEVQLRQTTRLSLSVQRAE